MGYVKLINHPDDDYTLPADTSMQQRQTFSSFMATRISMAMTWKPMTKDSTNSNI